MRGETKSENVFCFWIIRWGHIRSWTSQSDVKIYWCSIKLCNSKCSWPMVNLLESRRPHKQTLRVVLCIASSTAELLQPKFSCSAGTELQRAQGMSEGITTQRLAQGFTSASRSPWANLFYVFQLCPSWKQLGLDFLFNLWIFENSLVFQIAPVCGLCMLHFPAQVFYLCFQLCLLIFKLKLMNYQIKYFRES